MIFTIYINIYTIYWSLSSCSGKQLYNILYSKLHACGLQQACSMFFKGGGGKLIQKFLKSNKNKIKNEQTWWSFISLAFTMHVPKLLTTQSRTSVSSNTKWLHVLRKTVSRYNIGTQKVKIFTQNNINTCIQ